MNIRLLKYNDGQLKITSKSVRSDKLIRAEIRLSYDAVDDMKELIEFNENHKDQIEIR